MNAKRIKIPKEVIAYTGDEYDQEYTEVENMENRLLAEYLRKMTKPVRISEVEEGSDLEEILINELEGTQVFVIGEVYYQFSSVIRYTDNEIPLTAADEDTAPQVIGRKENGKTVFFVSTDFSEIKKVRKMTKLVLW